MKSFFVLIGIERNIAVVCTAKYLSGYIINGINFERWEVDYIKKLYIFTCTKATREFCGIGDNESFASVEIRQKKYQIWKY
jgi:hypothetical protein